MRIAWRDEPAPPGVDELWEPDLVVATTGTPIASIQSRSPSDATTQGMASPWALSSMSRTAAAPSPVGPGDAPEGAGVMNESSAITVLAAACAAAP